jgi:hypothetical protein
LCRRSLDTKPGTKVQLLGAIDVRNGCILLKVCRMKKKERKKGGGSVFAYMFPWLSRGSASDHRIANGNVAGVVVRVS